MVKSTVKTSRLDANASQMMKTISITAVREMNEPIDEIVFHIVYASGESEYRRGMPDSPRKCCGKKVILTPTNIIAKWILAHVSLRV